ncbi:MAG: MBL fold metallo-hydrolase [Clostridiales Family XIII bacterium]|jgi:glyoxylase-like metal-dependent hydrolase (beta-lactamase superfamily II)|nr:MBL fold metallo-hydrolase [Clostridiales Family XIII bacterium]
MENSPYRAIPISEKSWRIEEEGFVRFFLFEGTERALLVDTGAGAGDVKALVDSLTGRPAVLVNTHADPDHFGGNAGFAAASMHPSEFANYALQVGGNPAVLPLWEGDVIDIGGRSFEAILIPGHTPGSIALLDRENRILIAGDTISSAPVFIFGESRSIPAVAASLKKLEALSDAYDAVYPSHGSFPLGKEAVTAQREAAERLLAGTLPPQEPPFEVPAKMYAYGPASFLL